MADPSTYRPALGEIPTSPEVYRFLDEQGRVIYVGKVKSLRQHLSSYFRDLAALHPRTQKMVTTACTMGWTIVSTEVRSLTLEYSWIKEFNPHFNVVYKGGKSYPCLAVTVGETYPHVQVVRGAHKPGTRYLGPFVQVQPIRETVEQLLRVFPVHSCSIGVLRCAQASGRPCLLGYIDKCSTPYVGRTSAQGRRALVEDLYAFVAGRTGPYLCQVEAEIRAAVAALNSEKAARLCDDVAALRKVIEGNVVVLPDVTDADAFTLVHDGLEAAVRVFHVCGDQVRGQRGWVVDLIDDAGGTELIECLLEQVYVFLIDSADVGTVHHSGAPTSPGITASVGVGDRAPSSPQPRNDLHGFDSSTPQRKGESATTNVDDIAYMTTTAVPREILVPEPSSNAAIVRTWLAGLCGAKVGLRVPRRGDKAALMGTTHKNMRETLRLYKTRGVGDFTQRALALDELAGALDLSEAPLHVECYDISRIQDTYQTGSTVILKDGAPRKPGRRCFTVRGQDGDGATDDTAAMYEALTRRFKRFTAEQGRDEATARATREIEDTEDIIVASGLIDPETGKVQCFSHVPGLVIVDGGLSQVNAACTVLDELGIDMPLTGLAKRLEGVWVPGEEFPVILLRTSPALHPLQHLRDESHRFVITYHRKKRSTGMIRSVLNDTPGLGSARRVALLQEFGPVAHIRQADVDDIARVRDIGPALTSSILVHLNSPAAEQQCDFITHWIDISSKEHPA